MIVCGKDVIYIHYIEHKIILTYLYSFFLYIYIYIRYTENIDILKSFQVLTNNRNIERKSIFF